jgi:hypothetical protein
MSTKTAVLEQVGVDRKEGVISAVQKVDEFVTTAPNKLAAANTIITGLGGRSENNSDRARIIAKTMVAQVVGHKKPDQEAARQKADAMLTAEPYLKRDEIAEGKATAATEKRPTKTGRRKGAGNEKHAKADAFVEANKDKYTDRGELVRATAAHLGVDYAGAYFYVKRAEKKFGLKLTARKGRKPKVKAE